MRTRPVEVVRPRAGVERAGGAGHRDAEGVDLAGRPPAEEHVDGVLLERTEPELETPLDVAQGDQEPVLVAEAAVDAVDHEVEGQVREGRGVEDEGWLGSHGTSGTNIGMSGDRALVGGGIASLRGPVGGTRDRIESSDGSCQTGRDRGGCIIPCAARCRTCPRCPPPPPHPAASTASSTSSSARSRSTSSGSTTRCANPEALEARLADPLQYAQRVEIIVTGLGIEHLLPRHDARIARFLDIWIEDETTHGAALATLLDQLGLETYEPTEAPLPIHNQIAKLLGRLSQRAHEVVELIWSSSGAMNEHLAMSAYREMGVVVEELGERPLYETLFKRLRTHEAAHKGFYAAYARDVAHGHARAGSAAWPGRSSSTPTRRSVPARRSTSPRSAAPCGPSTPTAAGRRRSPTRSSASPRSCSPTASPCRRSCATPWPSASTA